MSNASHHGIIIEHPHSWSEMSSSRESATIKGNDEFENPLALDGIRVGLWKMFHLVMPNDVNVDAMFY